jgi:hypothetical protein
MITANRRARATIAFFTRDRSRVKKETIPCRSLNYIPKNYSQGFCLSPYPYR